MKPRNSVQLMILGAVMPALLVVIGCIGFVLFQLQQISDGFASFVDRDLVRLQAYNEMYANGVLGGQAIRSLMLNPADSESKKNLQDADKGFRSALALAVTMVEAGSPRAEMLARVDAQWDSLSQLREMFSETVGVLAGEPDRFISDEVPLWRDVSSELFQLRAEEQKQIALLKEMDKSQADTVMQTTSVIVVIAFVLTLVLTLWVLGRISHSLRFLSQSLVEISSGGGNLCAQLPVSGSCEIGQTSTAFNLFVGGLRDLVQQARDNTERVSGEIQHLAESAGQVSQSSERQHQEALYASEAVQLLANSIASVANFAEYVRQLSLESMGHAEDSQQLMESLTAEIAQVREAMMNIENTVSEFLLKSSEISTMTQQVRDIADQTNLLALNAAIEAARAGEYGRGFAVVADEVRKLAEKSAASAQQIDAITQSLDAGSNQMSHAVQRGVQSITTSVDVLGQVQTSLSKTRQGASDAGNGVVGIASAVSEHMESSQHIVRNMEAISQMAQESLSSVSGTADAVRRIRDLAQRTTLTFAKFKT